MGKFFQAFQPCVCVRAWLYVTFNILRKPPINDYFNVEIVKRSTTIAKNHITYIIVHFNLRTSGWVKFHYANSRYCRRTCVCLSAFDCVRARTHRVCVKECVSSLIHSIVIISINKFDAIGTKLNKHKAEKIYNLGLCTVH